MEILKADVLVVGGGTGGTAAAIQSARRGAQTILVSEFPWLGGMLTAAGVSAPDGNELAALQTGLWGAFLRELRQRQPGGLDQAWVSFFTYDPGVGAQIFADWVVALPNLMWLAGQVPVEVEHQGDRLTGVSFTNFKVQAQVIIDATELGDLLALAAIPHRWGWDWQSGWHEPSAPLTETALTQRYPVQAPTWVVVLRDVGETEAAPKILAAPGYQPGLFAGAWAGYTPDQVLNYGRLPGDRFMINWPQQGNDYGDRLHRLVGSATARSEFEREAQWHSQNFAHFIQTQLGRRYGLADVFPQLPNQLGGGAFALHPYYRESRRVQGLTTLTEWGILPQDDTQAAPLPIDQQGQMEAIALGNYPNDHHYPGEQFPLHPKAMRWGGRWTGTPFTIPYRCLIPAAMDGLLVCEKNISVSHIANGATRLQPVVLGIGQAAGMAAALCIEHQCQPRSLSVRSLQEALINEPLAPTAVVPLLNVSPHRRDWREQQQQVLNHPDCCLKIEPEAETALGAVSPQSPLAEFEGIFQRRGWQDYSLILESTAAVAAPMTVTLVTLDPTINQVLQTFSDAQPVRVWGTMNCAGNWLLVDAIDKATRY